MKEAITTPVTPTSPLPDATVGNETSGQAWGDFLLNQNDVWENTPPASARETDYSQEPLFAEKASSPFAIKIESVRQRIAGVLASDNPLLEAARPLLRALSEMPSRIVDMRQVELLKDILKREINHFSMLCDEVNIPWKKMAIVRYCLCTALDEAAHSMSWGIAAGWSQSNLLNYFEGDNDGGNKFFLLIGRISMSPAEYADVIEILLRILGLGFEGRYSIPEDGERQLVKIRQRLLTLLQSHRQESALPAIMAVMPDYPPPVRQRWRMPISLSLFITLFILSISWLGYRYWLFLEKQPLLAGINTLHDIQYTVAPPPEPRLSLSRLLEKEIAQGLLSVNENLMQSHVVLNSDNSFRSAEATLSQEMTAIIGRVATEILRVKGRVVITGHTDNVPIRTLAFNNNQQLSSARAKAVAEIFTTAGIPSEMISVKGMADSEPVSSNGTEEGRARNRRVEFLVTY